MKKFQGLIALILLLSSSCKKDEIIESPDPMTETPLRYTPMRIGDYWIYENFKVDTLGNDSSLQIMDSVYISNDTVIDGSTYYVLRGTHYPVHQRPGEILQILRESNGELINSVGKIIFSSINNRDTLDSHYLINHSDTLYFTYNKMASTPTQITVPSGTLDCLDLQQTFVMYQNISPINPRIFHHYYGSGIGLIQSSIAFLSESSHIERRLIRSQVTVNTD